MSASLKRNERSTGRSTGQVAGPRHFLDLADFDAATLRRMLEAEGFQIDRLHQFNKAGALPWWAYSRLLGAGSINKLILKLFDKTVCLSSRMDGLLPWRGLSLIAVASRASGHTDAVSSYQQEADREAMGRSV